MFLHISHSLIQVAEMRRTLTPSNSPMSSPSKHGDRFIPSRAGANWSINFHRINVSSAPLSYSSKPLNKEVVCLVLPRRTAVCIICSTASYPLLKSCSERASSAPQWQPAVCWALESRGRQHQCFPIPEQILLETFPDSRGAALT